MHFSVPRFQPDKEFAGTDRTQRRDGPVQFEEDPFGLDKFLTEAKKGKRPLDEPSRSRYAYHSLGSAVSDQFLFECGKVIGFAVLLRYMIGLKTPATFSSNQNNRDSLARVFPRYVSCMCLLRVATTCRSHILSFIWPVKFYFYQGKVREFCY